MRPSAVASEFGFVREDEGANLGAFVEFIQWFAGGVPGESWCADFVSLVLFIAYHKKAPLARTSSTRVMLAEARARGYVVADPQVDDLYFFVHPDGTPHHVGIVTRIPTSTAMPLMGIAGNTSADGLSSDGTGVFEHAIPEVPGEIVFVRLPPCP